MAWLTPQSGILPAQVQMQYSGGSPHVIPRKSTGELLAEAARVIAPAVKSYVQQQRTDKIANTLRAMQQADAAGQAPINDLEGEDWLRAQNLYQQFKDSQPDTAMDDLQYRKAYADTTAAEDRAYGDNPDTALPKAEHYPVTLPDGRTVYVTGNEAAQYYRQQNKPQADKFGANVGIARGKLDDKGEFTNQYTGAENGPMYQMRTPDGKRVVVPWSYYQQHATQAPATVEKPEAATVDEPALPAQSDTPATTTDTVPRVSAKEEYDALPSGTVYIAPDGKKRRKP